MNYIKITIIIPVYNNSKYLSKCLTSVINQTLKEIEIICVNDGSTDNSLEILEKYANIDNRIKIITQKNSGAGLARNKGIKNAIGEYIAFLDSDDYYLDTDVLESLYENAKKNDVLICGGEFAELNPNGTIFTQWEKTKEYGYKFESDEIIKYVDYQFDFGFTRFIYKRFFLLKNNIFFNGRKYFEDPTFFVTAMIAAKEFYAIKKIVYWYRINHKRNNWNIDKVCDLLCGINENMHISKVHQLTTLNRVTTERLLIDYINVISLFYKHEKVKNSLNIIYSNIIFTSISINLLNYYFKMSNEISYLRKSYSFIIGSKITWFPCKIRDFFKKMKGEIFNEKKKYSSNFSRRKR